MEAPQWYLRAAQGGFAKAQLTVGYEYADGHSSLPVDYTAALKWLRKAADQGESEAYRKISQMYDAGQGVPRDHAKAMGLLYDAAKFGDTDSQIEIARFYQRRGRDKHDFEEAYFWYSICAVHAVRYRGCLTPYHYCDDGRDIMPKYFTVAQKASIDERVKAWKPQTPITAKKKARTNVKEGRK
jgi:TPR repeat protein